MKKRVSISIDKGILEKLDREVDNVSIFSRSEAIEKTIEKHLSEKKKAVILAGGPPSNLFVSDANTYRPLLKINGKLLILDIIDKLKKAGYNDVIIIGSKEVLSEIYKNIGEAEVTYIEEKNHLGTAKTLQLAEEKVKGTFIFVPCDHYFEIDLKEMELYHKKNQGISTLVVYSGTKHAWDKSSIVELEGNKIINYVEHPKKKSSFLTSLLIGFAEPEVFSFIPKAKITYSLQEDVFPELAKKSRLFGYLFAGEWNNIHSKEDTKEIPK
jgi:NDP-sugar pyrophosphorylase family protein